VASSISFNIEHPRSTSFQRTQSVGFMFVGTNSVWTAIVLVSIWFVHDSGLNNRIYERIVVKNIWATRSTPGEVPEASHESGSLR
jgi:hypothetical protein